MTEDTTNLLGSVAVYPPPAEPYTLPTNQLGSAATEPYTPPGEPSPERVTGILGANNSGEGPAQTAAEWTPESRRGEPEITPFDAGSPAKRGILGAALYFDGPPCPRNHGVGRYVSTGKCPQCVREISQRKHRGRGVWTPEQDDYLREMWGCVSTRQIGRYLGRGRNAVIGRAHRIGLGESYKKDRSQNPRNIRQRFLTANPDAPRVISRHPFGNMMARVKGGKPVRKPTAPKVWIEPIEPSTDKACLIWDLTNESCRYPVGDSTGHLQLYCGDPSADLAANCQYCPYHWVKTHQQAHPPRGHHGRFIAQPWSKEERYIRPPERPL